MFEGEILQPSILIIPRITTTERDLLDYAEIGTIFYNTTTNKLNYCKVYGLANATNWSVITSS
jgi:hypothetical protein